MDDRQKDKENTLKNQLDKFVMKQKLNNNGSALLSVIVVIAFITILGTTMLYITSMNYQMKQTDYLNKKSFYKAEEALDSLKAELAWYDMSTAFGYAYQEVMIQYANLESDERQAAFNGAFLDKLNDMWSNRKTDRESVSQNLTHELRDRMLSAGYSTYFIEPDLASGEQPVGLVCDRANARFIITNVRVGYTQNGYSSFICTDIAFCVPDLNLQPDASSTQSVSDPILEREPVVLTDYIIYMNWTKY